MKQRIAALLSGAKEMRNFSGTPLLSVVGNQAEQPLLPFYVIPKRFLDKVKVLPNGCWEWTGSRCGLPRHKYGEVRTWNPSLQGRARAGKKTAHRFIYEIVNGVTVPEGEDVDHLCCNKLCVNPAHLEAVSHQENCRRRLSR